MGSLERVGHPQFILSTGCLQLLLPGDLDALMQQLQQQGSAIVGDPLRLGDKLFLS
ncbi:hypothetical protein [Synechococcus sp. B60.1]|uniref:hypothetical protein n=1 Tax=unclassified Synechococcus TaxID=2626047 RepID=UPI0039C352B6